MARIRGFREENQEVRATMSLYFMSASQMALCHILDLLAHFV